VDKKNCDDYGYDKNNKVYDECGSLADAVTGLYQKMKSWFHNTAKGIKHLNAKLRDWSKENIQVIDIADLLENEKEILPKLAAAWDKFNDNQLKQLKAASKEVMDKIIAEIPPEDLAALSTSVQKNLDIAQRILTRLKAITLEDVANWGQYLWERIPINNLVTMSWQVLQQIPLAELGKWTQEQWLKIPVDKLVKFTGEQINKINAKKVARLTNEYWDKVPVYQIVKFSVELVQSAGVLRNISATKIAYFTAEQWKAVPVREVVKFTIDKLQAIDYTALGAWSKDKWDQMPIDKIAAFVDQQIQSVPAEVVGNWTASMWLKFPTKECIMFTGEQLIAGANALAKLTKEQLAQYDWSQISDDALAQLPQELQEKIATLRQYATDFNAKEYKEQVIRLVNARSTKNTKLQALQLANDNPETTPELRQQLQNEYNVAVDAEIELEQAVEADQIQMYALPPTPSDSEVASSCGHATVSAAVLFAALQWL